MLEPRRMTRPHSSLEGSGENRLLATAKASNSNSNSNSGVRARSRRLRPPRTNQATQKIRTYVNNRYQGTDLWQIAFSRATLFHFHPFRRLNSHPTNRTSSFRHRMSYIVGLPRVEKLPTSELRQTGVRNTHTKKKKAYRRKRGLHVDPPCNLSFFSSHLIQQNNRRQLKSGRPGQTKQNKSNKTNHNVKRKEQNVRNYPLQQVDRPSRTQKSDKNSVTQKQKANQAQHENMALHVRRLISAAPLTPRPHPPSDLNTFTLTSTAHSRQLLLTEANLVSTSQGRCLKNNLTS